MAGTNISWDLSVVIEVNRVTDALREKLVSNGAGPHRVMFSQDGAVRVERRSTGSVDGVQVNVPLVLIGSAADLGTQLGDPTTEGPLRVAVADYAEQLMRGTDADVTTIAITRVRAFGEDGLRSTPHPADAPAVSPAVSPVPPRPTPRLAAERRPTRG